MSVEKNIDCGEYDLIRDLCYENDDADGRFLP